jgi:cold shock CspA family protein
MRIKGKITKWNDEKGFGFLKPSTGDKEVFVHISEFNNRNRRPKLNELVTYSLATDKQGRPRAVHATLPGDKRRKTANHSRGAFSIIASIIFFVIVGVTVLAGQISPIILAVYLVASLLSFFMYAMDK